MVKCIEQTTIKKKRLRMAQFCHFRANVRALFVTDLKIVAL